LRFARGGNASGKNGDGDRLLPYRHRRGSHRARQTVPVCGYLLALRALVAAVRYTVIPAHRQRHPLHLVRQQLLGAASEIRLALDRGELFMATASNTPARENDSDHRLTKPKHPVSANQTNGQVERIEPHAQGRPGESLSLQDRRPASPTPGQLRCYFLLRTQTQNPQRLDSLRAHLQMLDQNPALQAKSTPSSFGTIQLK